MSRILKGEIYWANLSPAVGSEISKNRPVLIVYNDINNQFAATVSILPITWTTAKIYPFEVFLPAGEGIYQTIQKRKLIKSAQLTNSVLVIKSAKSAAQN
jgi:mRNA interferase MazF